MKTVVRSKSDTKFIIEYKYVTEALNLNINKLKTDYVKKGQLLPKTNIVKARTSKETKTKKSNSYVLIIFYRGCTGKRINRRIKKKFYYFKFSNAMF